MIKNKVSQNSIPTFWDTFNGSLKIILYHFKAQKDKLRTFHNYSKPLFTGFLEFSVCLKSGQMCATNNKYATHMQQESQFNKSSKRDVFLNKRKTSLFLIFY